jgi:geranylgeranyl transferase type-2 subunit beta
MTRASKAGRAAVERDKRKSKSKPEAERRSHGESARFQSNPVYNLAATYLQRLTERLADGLALLPEEIRSKHASYLVRSQNADGGFSGREGGSDLYYTAFALRGLLVLDAVTPEICVHAGAFLRSCLTRHASVVDFYSLLYASVLVQAGGGPDVLAESPADWPERVATTLESFRAADGGYG